MLDPAFWRPGLEQYALATHVAVQFFDHQGNPIIECLNSQPLWKLLVAERPAVRGCAFSISGRRCACLQDSFNRREAVFACDGTGLVHFAVPLLVEEEILGGLLAGQVLDQYPEMLSLERAAREAGASPEQVWTMARQARPIGNGTLGVYAGLLTTLANALLQARYKSILESQRLEQIRQAQKLESIGLLAGGVAHDFNNLLTAVLGNASLILQDLPPGHKSSIHAANICQAAQRAAGLTRQLLAYAGQGMFIVQPSDLSELIRDMSELIQISIAKGVGLRLELANGLPAIESDSSQVQQIVMNLVINAAEAIESDKHGMVVIRTGVQELTVHDGFEVTVPTGIQPGRYVFLEVEDTGCGMDDATLAHIFDPFFTTKFTGRGLGLAAVWGIIRGHNGAVQVRSTPGQGTIFKVLFPAIERAPSARTPLDERVLLRGSGTILVVDDEVAVRQIAQAALQGAGYTVLLAENGEAAIDLFESAAERISIVLLDSTMPGLSGYETFLQLKRIRTGIKVLLSSGYNEEVATRRFQEQELEGFIQKPYTAAALAEKIMAALQAAKCEGTQPSPHARQFTEQ